MALVPLWVTVKVMVPAASSTETSATEKELVSLSVMVPVADRSEAAETWLGFCGVSVTVRVSLPSTIASSVIGTVKVCEPLVPAAKVGRASCRAGGSFSARAGSFEGKKGKAGRTAGGARLGGAGVVGAAA